MNGELTADALLDSGLPVPVVLGAIVEGEWRGADEPVSTIPGAPSGAVAAGVLVDACTCGASFQFRPGSLRAVCPGCGARYQIQERDCRAGR